MTSAPPATQAEEVVPLQGDVLFSLPARCFAASLRGKHRLDFHVSTDGKLVGMQWRFPKSLDCSTYDALSAWPPASDAKAVLPVPGEDLSAVQSLAPPGEPLCLPRSLAVNWSLTDPWMTGWLRVQTRRTLRSKAAFCLPAKHQEQNSCSRTGPRRPAHRAARRRRKRRRGWRRTGF